MIEPKRPDPPSFLEIATTVGLFVLILVLLFHEVPESSRSMVAQFLGAIATGWGVIMNYRYGSSSGSAAKSETLAALTGTGSGNEKTTATMKTEIQKTVTTEPKLEPAPEAPKEPPANP